jgi:Kef-type K+ transport system membrane component KefB
LEVDGMSFDWKRLSTLDRAIAGGAAVAFIAAFLPWYGVTVGPFSVSVSGWSAGFTAWAGALLLTAAGVILVLMRSGLKLSLPNVGPAVLVAGVAALGLLLVIIRWISFPRYHGVDVGARYGFYLALVAGIVETAAAVLAMRASGESMPWAQAAQHEHTEPAPEAPAAPE